MLFVLDIRRVFVSDQTVRFAGASRRDVLRYKRMQFILAGQIKTSTAYAPNSKGDVFKGGHWAGASGQSDWIQKDFSSSQLVTGISIGRAITDITTKGFRLVLKLKKPDGEWLTIDELHDTNINRTQLSGGAVGQSIPSYSKHLSPAIEATTFRLEFYGHGWFDATDIRIDTSKIAASSGLKITGVDGIVEVGKAGSETAPAGTKSQGKSPQHSNASGNWFLDGDKAVFRQAGGTINGSYDYSNGKVYGQINGHTWDGIRTQDRSNTRCPVSKHGSFYWGRFHLKFNDPFDRFSGLWGYCAETPSTDHHNWLGARR